MNILVTGAAGFTGKFIADHLEEQGHNVFRHTRDICDLARDDSLILGRDVVIHCAAAAGPWHSPDTIVRDNIIATRNLLSAAKHPPCRKFIFLSSMSVYGQTFGWLTEDSARTNPDPYGMSKSICEELISQSKIPAVSLRCPAIVGPNCTGRHWMARLVRELKAEKSIRIYNPYNIYNSVIHVSDICKFIDIILQRDISGHTPYNLAAKHPINVIGAARTLAKSLSIHTDFILTNGTARERKIGCEKVHTDFGWLPMDVTETIAKFAQETKDEQT